MNKHNLNSTPAIATPTTLVQGLNQLLAETYVVYLKTQNFHWNVTGPMFYSYHLLFESQYKELAGAVDELAERIRALGSFAPGSFVAYEKLSKIKEETNLPKALHMISLLRDNNKTIIETIKKILPLAEVADDEGTADLLIKRLGIHEKSVWMLESHLEE